MEKDLKALRIDRTAKPAPSSPKRWFGVTVAFFLGAVIMALLFTTFFKPATAPPDDSVNAAADPGVTPAVPDPLPSDSGPRDVLVASGYIVPHHRIEVGSKILGKVSWVGVEKSDKVQKGQLLVKLDDREFTAQLDQAKAGAAAAGARLAELEAGSRPEEIQRAQAELRRAQAEQESARLEYERLAALEGTEIISQHQIDTSKARLDAARAAVGVAQKSRDLAVLGPRDEQITSARAELERNQASIRYWESQLAETEIRAPITGTVLERIAEVGEMVSTAFAGGAVVVALADLNDLQVELDISQSDFRRIAEDDLCRMSPVTYPDRTYQCEIAEIAPEANRQRATIQVKVQILNPDSFLRPEMDAEVTFSRAATPQGDSNE